MKTASYGWLTLSGLKIEDALIGAYSEEQDTPRLLIVNLSLWVPIGKAAVQDTLNTTIDYAAIAKWITHVVHHRHYTLIESLAETITIGLLDNYPIERVKLELFKPNVLGGATASVLIERQRGYINPALVIPTFV